MAKVVKKKEEKGVILDFFKRKVHPGDKVIVLVKDYGYSGIRSADLAKGKYIGPKVGGKEFEYYDKDWKRYMTVRTQKPQCILLEKNKIIVPEEETAKKKSKAKERRMQAKWIANL